MPSDNNADKVVLISGINGYIATHIGLQLLQKGYRVRGTSRSISAKDHLLAGAFKGYESQYEHVEVKDIVAPGAFDEAVKGVHAILHTASPVDFTLKTVDEFFGPAIGGNLSILESAKSAAGPQLKAFVVTSSIAAIVDRWRQPADHAYSEADWNEMGESVARREFTAPVAYGASKAAAERAVWKWVEANHPAFAVAAVNPAVVTGPPVSWPATPDQLNTTLLPIWNIYSGGQVMPPQIGGAGYIDVRDVARMHIWAMEHPAQSNGERYLMSNGKAPPQAAADLLRDRFPDRDIIVGDPGQGYTPDYWFVSGEASSVSTKAYKALGVRRFITYDQSVLDTVDAFEKHWPGLAQNFKHKN
ncbi:uncharacterized protein PV07_06605 [Cladophialophora immunda]|uniref:NAD-dependent epimerase/dehydratase domain-containing protein n=1 Tax=Cladophialophora immunda TaxID=569365 RepID=A0A0D2C8I5_9EURO|nr:uncharacterized protein PV07_06605 [Cladophialophora immunda]KIW26800.1 hypothetical protein PV07_06605 [Cladophialophora immunda]OQV05281.1 hypothetical protein CLAIMM_10049 [Cladophialophora immunda]